MNIFYCSKAYFYLSKKKFLICSSNTEREEKLLET